MKAGRRLQELLGLRHAPVAVTFRDTAPAGTARIAAPAASSCTYWKLASEGQTFFTEAPDHYNCPIGAHTHGVDAPPEVMKELQGVVTMMVSLGYIRMEEVPGIPKREKPFGVAVYAPLAEAEGQPDVVILSGNARQVMLLSEAVQAAGASGGGLMGRPTCAALPEAMRTGQGVGSLGCIGNRVYTEQPDDEMYFVLPGRLVEAVTEKLATIVRANDELRKYHESRKTDRTR
jgi:uncharacterized protein (DUF169 family)